VRRAHNERGKYITIMCVPFISLARGDLSRKKWEGPRAVPVRVYYIGSVCVRMKIQWTADAAVTAAHVIHGAAAALLHIIIYIYVCVCV
jgi:hypothetical protein